MPYPPPLSPAAEALMARYAAAPSDAPHDCVRVLPTLSPDVVQMVGYDSTGRPRIRVEVPREDVSEAWERWLIAYVRRKERRHIQLVR